MCIKKDITEALAHLKSIYIKENGRYILAITIANDYTDEMKKITLPEKMMSPLSDYMESFPVKSILYPTITIATPKTLTLFTSVPL